MYGCFFIGLREGVGINVGGCVESEVWDVLGRIGYRIWKVWER